MTVVITHTVGTYSPGKLSVDALRALCLELQNLLSVALIQNDCCDNSHCGNIFSWEAIRGVRDQHAGLPHCAVPHHNAPGKMA